MTVSRQKRSYEPDPKPTREKAAVERKQRRKAVKPVSTKRAALNTDYLRARAAFLDDHKRCQAQLPGCGRYSTDVHHRRGRVGDAFLDAADFVALCRRCHTFLEEHPDDAKALGYSGRRNGE